MCIHLGGDKQVEAIALHCEGCGRDFVICRSCYRNHKYCSEECSGRMELVKRKPVQSKYSKSEKGRLSQKLRDARYLEKKKIKQKLLTALQS